MNSLKKMMALALFAVLMSQNLSAYAMRKVELTEPGPISVPSGHSYSQEEVQTAITAGARKHHWRVQSQTPGTVRLILEEHDGRIVLVMDAIYDEKSYSLKYVRSVGLDYVKGVPTAIVSNPNSNTVSVNSADHQKTTIHASYARWIKGLVNAIDAELRIVQIN